MIAFRCFCAAAALAIGAGALPAAAQQAGQQVAARGEGLDEVVVTAERSNRSLRDSASSIAVVSQGDMDRAPGIFSTDDVISRIPNVVTVRPGNAAPAVRGLDGTGPAVGANAFFAGTRPRVNFLLDGRTLTFNEVIYLDGMLWDTQQLEVYRGPQSTLQGRNAIGGVIAIKTADPTFEWSGKARAAIGGDKARQLSGAVGGPLVDNVLAFRVAADWRTENNFVKFTPYTAREDGVSAETKQIDNPSRQLARSLRGKLLFTPGDDLRAMITLSHTNSYGPQTNNVLRPFSRHLTSFGPQPRFQTRANVGIGDVSWTLSDAATLSAFLTGSDFRVRRFARLNDGNARIDGKEGTAEPRLRLTNDDGSLSGFLAGYLFHSSQREEIDLFGVGRFKDTTNTRAVFGEVTWKPTDRFDLTAGARYESEERDRINTALYAFPIDFHKTFNAFLPRGTVAFHATEEVTVGATVGRGYNAGGAGFAFNPPFPTFVYEKETVTNYEAFLRADLMERRLRLQANAFYNDYHGLQLPFDVNPDPAISAPVIRNADKATTYGAELEARYQATEGLQLFANLGLLRTKVNRYADPTVQGNDLPRSPAYTFHTGFVATLLEGLELSADVRVTDAYHSEVFNDARGKTDTYAVANAQISYRTGPGRVFLSVTNLFDSTDVQQLNPGPTPATDNAVLSHPRRLTVGVEMSF